MIKRNKLNPAPRGVTLADLKKTLQLAESFGLRLVKPRKGCPHDTDGDGNCHLCIRRPGGCFNK